MKAVTSFDTQGNWPPRRRNNLEQPIPQYENRSAIKSLGAARFPPATVAQAPQDRL